MNIIVQIFKTTINKNCTQDTYKNNHPESQNSVLSQEKNDENTTLNKVNTIICNSKTDFDNISNNLKHGEKLTLKMPKILNGTKLMLFAGLTNVSSHPISESDELVTGTKPIWIQGSSIEVNFKKSNKSNPVSDAFDVLNIDTNNLFDNDENKTKNIKCDATNKRTRKKCKNCTCGNNLDIDTNDTTKTDLQSFRSACGNCFRGDEFRCTNCPHLGMPAFILNDRVIINTNDDSCNLFN